MRGSHHHLHGRRGGCGATLAESEFDDGPNSVDKRKSTDPDRFGYASVHYVLSLKPSRAQLSEYRRFAGLKFELQIRSILQHAWAEIEHDLQYKTEQAVPKEIRRRFARLAGLLELADAEFVGLRGQIHEYQARVATQIRTVPDEVLIDCDSLRAFISEDPLVLELDTRISAAVGLELVDDIVELDLPLRALNHTGLKTVGAVREALVAAGRRFLLFFQLSCQRAIQIAGKERAASLCRGASLALSSVCTVWPLLTVPGR